MKNEVFVKDWLKRARSNLAVAAAGKTSEEVLYEDLCFHCQQSVEKSIKALLISIDKEFPPTHSIARLLKLVSEAGIRVSEKIKKAIDLTDYAVKMRYPGEQEPATSREYDQALKMATEVYTWVANLIEKGTK